MASTPIADLTYRSYDGPLEAPTMRWWVVAKACMKLAIMKRGFWVWSVMSAYWYFVLATIFYFVDVIGQTSPQVSTGFFNTVIWKDKFLDAFSISQMLLFILALLIGIGSIANDNRSNALLVYLSRPCSKLDYLAGKWVSIFLPILAVTAVPALVFYGYCLISFKQYGFTTQDPGFFWHFLLVLPLPAILHASLCVGISSLFQQSRLAGATYAGLYILPLFFTNAMKVIFALNSEFVTRHGRVMHAGSHAPDFVASLFYCSVDGIQIGLAKVFLHTNGTPLLGPGVGSPMIPAPNGLIFGVAFLLVCLGSVFLAWTQIRAVEVVRG